MLVHCAYTLIKKDTSIRYPNNLKKKIFQKQHLIDWLHHYYDITL